MHSPLHDLKSKKEIKPGLISWACAENVPLVQHPAGNIWCDPFEWFTLHFCQRVKYFCGNIYQPGRSTVCVCQPADADCQQRLTAPLYEELQLPFAKIYRGQSPRLWSSTDFACWALNRLIFDIDEDIFIWESSGNQVLDHKNQISLEASQH